MLITRDEALALLRQYNKEPFHIQHALTVEGVMRWYANELGFGEEADFWALCGLLHDVDFEMFPEDLGPIIQEQIAAGTITYYEPQPATEIPVWVSFLPTISIAALVIS